MKQKDDLGHKPYDVNGKVCVTHGVLRIEGTRAQIIGAIAAREKLTVTIERGLKEEFYIALFRKQFKKSDNIVLRKIGALVGIPGTGLVDAARRPRHAHGGTRWDLTVTDYDPGGDSMRLRGEYNSERLAKAVAALFENVCGH